MSSMKNAMKTQKVHRERHQNEERAHLGPLEKKKDYKIRAKDQAKKKKLLRKLHKKALERNPDEFHFHMSKSMVVDGRHKEEAQQEKLTIKVVQTDLTYVKFRRTMEQKRIEKLRSSLHFLEPSGEDEEPQNTHLLFVDTPEEAANTSPASLLNTVPELLGRRFNRPTREQLQNFEEHMSGLLADVKSASSVKAKSYKELCRRLQRDDKLRLLQEQLEVKLARLQHDERNKKLKIKLPPPKRVKKGNSVEAAVYKWPKIRKR